VVQDLAINLVASVLAAAAAWILQRVLSLRRLARMRAFFGLQHGAPCLLVVGRHASSPREHSVHRDDVAALAELAALAKECGARADVVTAAEAPVGLGKVTEFCVGGEGNNPRTAVHLRALLPGVTGWRWEETRAKLTFAVGGERFDRDPGKDEYAIVARVGAPSRPVFVIMGQIAICNLAAARFLATRHRQLYRRYGADRPFCLVLRVVEGKTYGPDLVEEVADVTEAALGPRATPVPAPAPRRALWPGRTAGRRPKDEAPTA